MDDSWVRHLEAVAAQLIARVRDDDPAANDRWLAHQRPDDVPPVEWYRDLAFALAAMAPTDRTVAELTAWTRAPLVAELVAERFGRPPVATGGRRDVP